MHSENRSRYLEWLSRENAAAVVPCGSPQFRNGDAEYRFRPESDFVYLTGFAEPESVLVLVPGRKDGRSVLFLRDLDREAEIWTGRRLGVEAAPGFLGVEEALPIERFWDELPGLLIGHEHVVFRSGLDESYDRRMIEVLAETRNRSRRGVVAPLETIDPTFNLHEQRLVKTEAELERMRRAAAISTEAHLAAMRTTAPGKNEAEIDALLEYTFRRNGCTGAAYTNIVAGGANACILHYVENNQPLRDGDLLLIDAGAEWDYYASDVTRTFPVNGSFTSEQRALYQVVLAAQRAGIDEVAPGSTQMQVHEAAVGVLVDGLIELGLMEGARDEIIEDETYRRFYMHKTGHWLGLDVHDCGAYFVEGRARAYEPGMVLTVEPGVYVAPDDETVEERWRGIGIRIEDDVLVTEAGSEVLTAAVPKDVDEVEAVCRAAALQPAP